jgi:putative FmdB family regulatory protein
MPVYEYQCECSEDVVPFTMSISEYKELQECKKCGNSMKRFYTPVGAQFKGSGFYSTDNPK